MKPTTLGNTRRKILDLLRRSPLTANEIADALELTHNAVRVHLSVLHRDGLVCESGFQESGTRPAVIYALTPQTDSMFSRAYIPFVAQLLEVLGEQMPRAALEKLMRTVGLRLAAEWAPLQGDLPQRVKAASLLLEQLGALTEVTKQNGGFIVRGRGCVLAEAVHGRPEVCRVLESLLAELTQVPVRECCERGEHPRCCFEINLPARPSRAAGRLSRT
jgi:predicted ArsR family transcriptional regulator